MINCCSNSSIDVESKLYRVIMSFRKDFKVLKDNPAVLKSFYEYVSAKYNINCERRMVLVERLLFQDLLQKYRRSIPPRPLLYSKIKLYSWLEPVHLNIKDLIDQPTVDLFHKVPQQVSVSEMIDRYMETVESIYKSIGKDSEHSRFFSVFVLVLVKSQRDDLDHLLFFMEKFRRSPLDSCGSKCLKGHREDEVNYYLTVFKAGLEFIEKLEYYDLNISQEEFNQKIKHVDL